jgi:hypothetical protein
MNKKKDKKKKKKRVIQIIQPPNQQPVKVEKLKSENTLEAHLKRKILNF